VLTAALQVEQQLPCVSLLQLHCTAHTPELLLLLVLVLVIVLLMLLVLLKSKVIY
jgi:hypothetical protein